MMKTILENQFVSIARKDEDTFLILHEGRKTGWLKKEIKDRSLEITFEIEPAYRGNHYASNAVYLLTPYLHDACYVRHLHACTHKDNAMARHVLEHNGYAIVSKDDSHIYYSHAKAETRKDDAYDPKGMKVLYFAGGCFWGTERIFQMLDGVRETKTGYANGSTPNPTYEEVCRNETGYRETVRVTYDPSLISEETLLDAYFLCIDPTQINRQADDTGSQYQTGVYYRDQTLLPVIEKKFDEEKKKYSSFHVELQPLKNFYEAEEYHQDYLSKNPDGYCHITKVELAEVKKLNHRKQKG
jgi:methionine-S-sulfoxide reductase